MNSNHSDTGSEPAVGAKSGPAVGSSDATSVGSAGEIQLENEHFRVTRWTIDPGGHIPMHEHLFEYVVVPMTGGTLHVTNADGSQIESPLTPGVTYSRPAGSEHTIANRDGSEPIVFVEVERLS